MTRTLLVRNKQPQHSLPGIAHKQTSSAEKIRRKRATVASYSMLYRFLCNALQRASQKAKKYGANAPQLRAIRCSIDYYVMLCNEQAKKQKNTAQTRHSCTISPLRQPGEPSPVRERKEKTKKYGANAPQLHPILGGRTLATGCQPAGHVR